MAGDGLPVVEGIVVEVVDLLDARDFGRKPAVRLAVVEYDGIRVQSLLGTAVFVVGTVIRWPTAVEGKRRSFPGLARSPQSRLPQPALNDTQ